MKTLSVPDRLKEIMELTEAIKDELRFPGEISEEMRNALFETIVSIPWDLMRCEEVCKVCSAQELQVDYIPEAWKDNMHAIVNDIRRACQTLLPHVSMPQATPVRLIESEYQEWKRWNEWHKKGECQSRPVPINYTNIESVIRLEAGIAQRPWNRSLVHDAANNLYSMAYERFYKQWPWAAVRGPTVGYAFYDKRYCTSGIDLTIHRIGMHPLATGKDVTEMMEALVGRDSIERTMMSEDFSVTTYVDEANTDLLVQLRSCFENVKNEVLERDFFDDGQSVSGAIRMQLQPKNVPWVKRG